MILQMQPAPARPELMKLLEKAKLDYDNMTLEQKAEMHRQQRRSYVIGEMSMGDDKDEAKFSAALQAGDTDTLDRLKIESDARGKAARAWLDENGY